MTRQGNTIFVDADEAEGKLPVLLKAVEEQGQTVQIRRGNKIVAVLRAEPQKDPLQPHPELSATYIAEDAFAPVDEEDWPADCR